MDMVWKWFGRCFEMVWRWLGDCMEVVCIWLVVCIRTVFEMVWNLLWAASEQFPFILDWNLIEHLLESAIGCLGAVVLHFELEMN